MSEQIKFHGGCNGCTMQTKQGIVGCVGCQFFEGNWGLPDLNDSHADEERQMAEIRKGAKIQAIGLNPIPKEEDTPLDEQLEIAVDAEDYERAILIRDQIAKEKPYRDALNAAISKGDYDEASRIREKNKKGFFGKLGDWFS
tara:strand:- start:4401 stop:4826 length:426 start_codon:yes stop_codon:yes gene_type:complete